MRLVMPRCCEFAEDSAHGAVEDSHGRRRVQFLQHASECAPACDPVKQTPSIRALVFGFAAHVGSMANETQVVPARFFGGVAHADSRLSMAF